MPDRLATSAGAVPQQRASLWQVIRDQRKTIIVGLVLAVAAFWILGQLDEWRLATSLAIGVGLGLINHLATERWLLGLVVLTVVAVTVAVVFWPDGIGVLLGLAVFRLIALAMTTIPLLKELKEQ